MSRINGVLLQFFEWYLPPNAKHWKKVAKLAKELNEKGFTSVWLPPAYKCSGGIYDTGYAVYDLYDLGEFNQKGTIPTKYGTKDEYLEAIQELQKNNIYVLADIVLNHRIGADATEKVLAIQNNPSNRNEEIGKEELITAWTKYNFSGRNNKYSSFKWNWTHFHGVDWDEENDKKSIYRFVKKEWDKSVDKENGNFDYLMGADVDVKNEEVINELNSWGSWYIKFTGVDGFRLDALKHIDSSFFEGWLTNLRRNSNKELFAVGEYWNTNIEVLKEYLKNVNYSMSLFDVPLHYHFYEAATTNGSYDMSKIFDNTVTQIYPDKSVTFVDNHDTQPGQGIESWIPEWFRPLAYALILLRFQGYPCVFYGDYFGISHDNINPISTTLDIFLYLRKNLCYGTQKDYLDNNNIIGWTLSGDDEHPNSGFAVVLSNGEGGAKQMNVGKNLANCVLYDITRNLKETVYVDNDGNGIFYTKGGSVSVWVKKDIVAE